MAETMECMHPDKTAMFDAMRAQYLSLTYDDVIILPVRSHVPAGEQDTTSLFTTGIELKTPVVSAAMDTVTESRMAIAMAKMGGLGIIHAGLEIDEQKDQTRTVKRFLSGLIEDPIFYQTDQTLQEIKDDYLSRNLHFRKFLLRDANGKLAGLITGRNFSFPDDLSARAEDVMIPLSRLEWAPVGTEIDAAYQRMQKGMNTTLPLLDHNGEIAGLYVWKDVEAIVRGRTDLYNVDERKRLRVGAAIPVDRDVKNVMERVETVLKWTDALVLDSSQGSSDLALEILREIKASFPEAQIMAGNVTDPNSAVELADNGADGVKIGVGGGSICSTREETGAGRPQVTAVYECVKALEGRHIPVCADGGIVYRGGVPIAIAAGAHSVMLGLMLAGTEESAAPVYEDPNGAKYKLYRGMASISALKASRGNRSRYDANDIDKLLAEGVEAAVPLKGPVEDEMNLLAWALRRGMTQAGSSDIRSHRLNALLERVTPAGAEEAHPHDVKVITIRELAKRAIAA